MQKILGNVRDKSLEIIVIIEIIEIEFDSLKNNID